MPYIQKYFKKEKRWICSCGRINYPEDQICAFCRQPKTAAAAVKKRKKGEPRIKSSRTNYNGRWYHSAFEAKYAEHLDWRKQAGEITEWKPQHLIEIKVNGKKWRNYRIDFRAIRANGTIEYIECKGFATEEWKQKWDLLVILKDELLEPDSELLLVKK